MFTLMLQFGKHADTAIRAGMSACQPGKASPEIAAAAAAAVTKGWTPDLNGIQVLTPNLRSKLADALGHLAFNLWAAQNKGKPL